MHNCLEFSQPLECLHQALQTQEKSFLLLKYCFFRKILLLCRLTFFLQKCGAYLRAELNAIVIPLSTAFTRITAAALINTPPPMRRLFEGGTYWTNYCNWQLKSLLHLGQIVITFRNLIHLGQMLLHLGSFITFITLGSFINVLSASLSIEGHQKLIAIMWKRHILSQVNTTLKKTTTFILVNITS